MKLREQAEFFKDYRINKQEFEKYGLDWKELEDIYRDYCGKQSLFNSAASSITSFLINEKNIHSVRSRVKDPEHLIEKIIRKTIEKNRDKPDGDYKITIGDYTTKITDLIGIRILHLYKEEAILIDQKIRDNWTPYETPTVYKREGDEDLDYVCENPKLFNTEVHSAGYRSWHYLIKQQLTKIETIAEVQVRTIFEEGWSEIDHQLRYPYDLDNEILNDQLKVLNRLAGSADEMVNSIKDMLETMTRLETEKDQQDKVIDALKKELSQISNIKGVEKKSLEEKVTLLGNMVATSKSSIDPEIIKRIALIHERLNLSPENLAKASSNLAKSFSDRNKVLEKIQ